MSVRTVVYKTCKLHNRADAETMERLCSDCRRATFRASMKARGITVTIPTYKGPICGTYSRTQDADWKAWAARQNEKRASARYEESFT